MPVRRYDDVTPGQPPSAARQNQIQDDLTRSQKVSVGPGLVMHNTPGGVVISLARRPPVAFGMIPALITGSTVVGASGNCQWRYAWTEAEKTESGYTSGGWTAVSEGATGEAYNMCEIRNHIDIGSGERLYGSGVNSGNLIGDFMPQPCPNGVAVLLLPTEGPDGTEYWFSYANGTDGVCG